MVMIFVGDAIMLFGIAKNHYTEWIEEISSSIHVLYNGQIL